MDTEAAIPYTRLVDVGVILESADRLFALPQALSERPDLDQHLLSAGNLSRRSCAVSLASSSSTSSDRGGTAVYRREMATARAKARTCGRARVTGDAFFDFEHGQSGVAPNDDRATPAPRLSLPQQLTPPRLSVSCLRLVTQPV